MKSDIYEMEKLPIIYNNKNISKDNSLKIQSVQKRNAVIDEFLKNLDNKKDNLNNSGSSKNSDNEENDIDDIFKDAKKLIKEVKPIEESKKRIKRPKFYGRKIPSLFLSNKNYVNNLNKEVNNNICSALSFDNDFDTHSNKIEKIPNSECINNTNDNNNQKKFNTYITDYESLKNKKIIDLKNLKFRNYNSKNYFLNSLKSVNNQKISNIINTEIKNNNSKWTNKKLLNNFDSYFSSNSPLNYYVNNLKQIRSKSHFGNRNKKNNINTLNVESINLSPNLIAANLYKNNSFFQKGLKRNYTAKIESNIFTNHNISNKIFSEKKENKNKKIFKVLSDNEEENFIIKRNLYNNNSFKKLFENRNKNYDINWMNTIMNIKNKFNENISNKNDLSKKQLKLKLAQLEINYKFKKENKLFLNGKTNK